jgi:PAT family acetyl-CoA transporter-like MFS transporter 1
MLFFFLSVQDIAVDGWAVEMLDPKNSAYASTCQATGQRIGTFIGSSFFIALNSEEFCNKYIFSTPKEEPLLSVSAFLFYWSAFMLMTTLYVLFVSKETPYLHDGVEEEPEFPLSQTLEMIKDILRQPHT